MIIHKSDRFEISFSEGVAKKTDGKDIRTMKFYPERDLYGISGEIDELTAWRILHDVACQLKQIDTPVSPDHIFIDGDGFHLSEWSESKDPRFRAPEGYSSVWALGACVFRIFLDCHVFQGLGGKGQSPAAPVPTLRKELPALSSIIARCLAYPPKDRPSLDEIIAVADDNISRCSKLRREHPPLKQSVDAPVHIDDIDRFWPEEMS